MAPKSHLVLSSFGCLIWYAGWSPSSKSQTYIRCQWIRYPVGIELPDGIAVVLGYWAVLRVFHLNWVCSQIPTDAGLTVYVCILCICDKIIC